MRTYTLSRGRYQCDVPAPDVLPEAGQILVCVNSFSTLAGINYQPGDELKLIARTEKAPHGISSSLGNWIVECKKRVSVWTNIEWAMVDGLLKVKQS